LEQCLPLTRTGVGWTGKADIIVVLVLVQVPTTAIKPVAAHAPQLKKSQ
jgi:hypothetical protein